MPFCGRNRNAFAFFALFTIFCIWFLSQLHSTHHVKLYPFYELKGPQFKILAQNRTVVGFERENNMKWVKPYYFIHLTDVQFGCIARYGNKSLPKGSYQTELDRSLKFIATINLLKPRPKFIMMTGDVSEEWPGKGDDSIKRAQINAFKKAFSENLSPEIPLILIPGNHDVGNSPGPDDISSYRADFGDDYYVFYVSGVKYIALNTQYIWETPEKLVKEELVQKAWLRDVLRQDLKTKPFKHVIIFQHVPWFYKHGEEQSSTNNIGMQQRKDYVNMFNYHKIKNVFSGHIHGNFVAREDGLEIVVTSALSCQFMHHKPGYRLVKVFTNRVFHEFYDLDDSPVIYTH